MAITDINISEQLETSAPSIKYEGNEGPKSPEEQQQMMLEQQIAAQDYSSPEYKIKLIEKLMEGGLDYGAAYTEADRLIELMLGRRKGAAYGGIMDVGGRRRYGWGSRLRKLIPNEVAKVAEVAAPFVAPFNPIAAGLMSGIGGWDRHGSLGKGLKSGLMNYGLGQAARYAGGAGFQTGINPMTGSGVQGAGFFSSPMGTETGLGKWFDQRGKAAEMSGLETISDAQKGHVLAPAGHPENQFMSVTEKASSDLGSDLKKEGFLKGIMKNIDEAGMSTKALMGIVGASSVAGLMTAMQAPEKLEAVDRGVGMPGGISAIRTEVIEAFKDPTGEKLKAIRIKYPFLGAKETKNIDIMAEGGRIGLYAGGQSIPSDYTMEDARKTSMQDKMGGITEIMKQADLSRKGDVGQMYAAEGGLMDLGGMEKDYRNEGGFVPIGGKEKADDVPARLSKNEFVFTADAVRGAGGGDIDKGAEIMENIMKNLEQGGQISEETQGLTGAQEMFGVSERLSEVI